MAEIYRGTILVLLLLDVLEAQLVLLEEQLIFLGALSGDFAGDAGRIATDAIMKSTKTMKDEVVISKGALLESADKETIAEFEKVSKQMAKERKMQTLEVVLKHYSPRGKPQ